MNKWIRLAAVSFAGIIFSIIALFLLQSIAGQAGTQNAHGGNAHPPDAAYQQVIYGPGYLTGAGHNYGQPVAYGYQAGPYMYYGSPNSVQNYGYPAYYPQPGVAYPGNPYAAYPVSYNPAGTYGGMPYSYQLQQQQLQLIQLKQQLLEMKSQLGNMTNQGGMYGNAMMPMMPM